MGPDSDLGVIPTDPPVPWTAPAVEDRGGGRPLPAAEGEETRRPAPTRSLITVLAFAMVIIPFAVLLTRLLAAPGAHLYLPDDLALIDLHTRRALQWKQQLGVFDHSGWNHPGPSYFYLLSVVYRVLGSGAKAMFVGAVLINALAAVACVGVVRRRSTPARALWASLWLCVLGSLLAAVGPGSVTYSEGALGGLVSPWNPMVVIFPLLLLILLCASAIDRSLLSLLGAVLVGSFVIQTNISTLVVVVALWVAVLVMAAFTAVTDRGRSATSVGAPGSPDARRPAWRPAPGIWAVAGLVVLALMWLPPIIQQMTNNPGNLTLIYRFFTSGYPGPTIAESVRSVVAVYGVLFIGPSEVMSSYLGHAPQHQAVAVIATVLALVIGVVTTTVGIRQANRFAAGLGGLSLIGLAAMVVAVSHVEGEVYGYLVVWAVAVPIAAVIGVGMVRLPRATSAHRRIPAASRSMVRVAACLVGVVASVVLCVRAAAIPPLASVSDPEVGELVSLVVPALSGSRTVFVNDSGAGVTSDARILDVERFIGLVNQLDQRGYSPTVNRLWRAQFGPGFEAVGTEDHSIELRTWYPTSPRAPGYLGRVGDLAVTVSRSDQGHSTDPADTPG
jgi:hypothetical protein